MSTSQPVAELDVRFSDPGIEPTPWADTLALLEGAELFWLTTIRRDGRPHVTPVVAVWHENALYFSTAAFEQKMRNLEHSDKVVATTGNNEWMSGLDVVVEGAATVITDPDLLKVAVDAFDRKYGGDNSWNLELVDGVAQVAGHPAVLLRIEPGKVLAFGKAPHAQTRYRLAA
ncbi:pyridoxamine 5'-phosphate oxidase family protein [Saccharothrix violaceirubra]|uniref:Nitroimidazol reductase NimA-like FMN-containing flavoprotein (Pyridoxamine 5'-phosphate oxidase superfamily) n=1 Tax=Saccharothrix violaceirubra TaxID=413306 RepID=A0A7W7WWI3_9PSEU|nr:pyridoxamine 5'-phosphate oxidase family protein [Saccharothrix violaceirubra]MBB4966409.1 nitroimidazol reductase NimA-like FMN-containing flavoprotein (pyridoxamine 5'-phosphate oxidase superfamily) [Saccharothrix violaceirubra]